MFKNFISWILNIKDVDFEQLLTFIVKSLEFYASNDSKVTGAVLICHYPNELSL